MTENKWKSVIMDQLEALKLSDPAYAAAHAKGGAYDGEQVEIGHHGPAGGAQAVGPGL
nr:MAG TPA: hypothetical protein [Caudoviricetes sp.]